MSKKRDIFCCGCGETVSARFTDGGEVYPHRKDLKALPFWKCDACGNFVGCHHKTKNRTKPLGVIPTPELKKARQHIHRILDPLWKSGRFDRRELYSMIAHALDIEEYHTADIRSIEEARDVYRTVKELEASHA
ncbi:MAG: zinc-finger-containing protein [Nitratireductor rhodophyticola]|uniref:zinc-finger-containing protein n=1 Tax=Nitratireductor rhodophyticola TaxID=2854036 RepID=UPI0032D94D3A